MSSTTERFLPTHRRTLATWASIAWLSAMAIGQHATASTINPESERIAEIDRLLVETFQPTHPGAVVIVSRDGKPLLKKAYGLADTEKNTALQFTDTMRIGSVTKPFTAMAILLLEEDGKLSVQDEITRYLPDFSTPGRKITIAHLLSHTSGIGVYTQSPKLREMIRPETTTAEVVILTTDGLISAARSAKLSGAPRAKAGAMGARASVRPRPSAISAVEARRGWKTG